MRGRKPHKVILQAEQIEVLQTHLKTGKTEQRVARRARILLLSHEGKYPWEIADYVGCDRTTVWDFRQRFRERGLDALYDLPRPGAPRRISPPCRELRFKRWLVCHRAKRGGRSRIGPVVIWLFRLSAMTF